MSSTNTQTTSGSDLNKALSSTSWADEGEKEEKEQPQVPGKDKFADLLENDLAVGLSPDQLKYVENNTLSRLGLDILAEKIGVGGIELVRWLLQDTNNKTMLNLIINDCLKYKEDTQAAIKANFDGDEWSGPKDSVTSEMYRLKMSAVEGARSVMLHNYVISSDKIETLQGERARVSFTKGVLPDLAITTDEGEVTVSGLQSMCTYMGFAKKTTKGGSPIVNPSYYATMTDRLRLARLPMPKYTVWEGVSQLAAAEYAKRNSTNRTFNKVSVVQNVPEEVKTVAGLFQETWIPKAIELCRSLNTADWNPSEVKIPPNFAFKPVDLQHDRDFRAAFGKELAQTAKEWDDFSSIKANGIAVGKKWLIPLRATWPNVRVSYAIGHSSRNNWDGSLDLFGVRKLNGNFYDQDWDQLAEADDDLHQPEDIDLQPDMSLFKSKFTIPPRNENPDQRYYTLYSDIFFAQEYKNRSSISSETYQDDMMKYLGRLKELVDAGWQVVFKVVPKQWQREWDRDTLIYMYFSKYYVRPFFSGRMHNGEVIYAIHRTQLNNKYFLVDQAILTKIHKFSEYRMMIGNLLRNYGITWGIPVSQNIPQITPIAIHLNKAKISQSWGMILRMEQSSVSRVVSTDDADDLLQKHKDAVTARKEKKANSAKTPIDDKTVQAVAKTIVPVASTVKKIRRLRHIDGPQSK